MPRQTRSKEQVKDTLLTELDNIISDPEVGVSVKLKAIELMGREFGLFVTQSKVNVDVNTVVRHLTDQQLTLLSVQTVQPESEVIEIESTILEA